MRKGLMLLAAIGAIGCKRSSSDQTTSTGALRFLPASAELALRVDLARARTWSRWSELSGTALRKLGRPLEAVKTACGLDVVAEAKSFVVATGGDTNALVLEGLPRDKVVACPGKLGSAMPGLAVTPDGDRFGISIGGSSVASAVLLPSGELVVVSRKGAGIDAAAWRTEVESGSGAAPAWWSELDQVQPIAVRVQDAQRTVAGSAQLGDPLVLRVKADAPTQDAANTDAARAKAIVEFLTKAEAGTGRVEPKGMTLYADFTAAGPQIDKLLAAALSALDGGPRAPEAPQSTNTSPIDCAELGPAVAKYLATNLSVMAPDQRAQTQAVFEKIGAPLQKAYVESCTAGAWAPQAIHCHVDNAESVPRFEKCRLVLTAEQRTKFDDAVKAALAAP